MLVHCSRDHSSPCQRDVAFCHSEPVPSLGCRVLIALHIALVLVVMVAGGCARVTADDEPARLAAEDAVIAGSDDWSPADGSGGAAADGASTPDADDGAAEADSGAGPLGGRS